MAPGGNRVKGFGDGQADSPRFFDERGIVSFGVCSGWIIHQFAIARKRVH
jgi:hypothetical protein